MKHPSLSFSFAPSFDGLLDMQQLEAYGQSNIDYAIFKNFGYKGLYGGLDAKGIHTKKGLKKSDQILDHMGSKELAANLFRDTQTEEKLQRDNIQGKKLANQTHFEIGKKVRKTIEEIGGTMPENMPVVKRKVSAQLKKIGFAE